MASTIFLLCNCQRPEETAAASEEVTASMQQQSDAVEQVAQSASGLSSLAAELMEKLSHFKIQ